MGLLDTKKWKNHINRIPINDSASRVDSSIFCKGLPESSFGGEGNNISSVRLRKDWTIIQYNDADNELGVYARDDIREMMAVGSNSNVNIIVLYDTYAE